MHNSQYGQLLFQGIGNGTIKRNNFILIGYNTFARRTWIYFSSILLNLGEEHAFAGWLNKSWEIQGNFLFKNWKIEFVGSVSQHSYWTGEGAFLCVSTRLRNLLFSLFLIHSHISSLLITTFLLQMLTFGETIEFPFINKDYASPCQPLKNVYLPHVMLLVKTKMRLGKNT